MYVTAGNKMIVGQFTVYGLYSHSSSPVSITPLPICVDGVEGSYIATQ